MTILKRCRGAADDIRRLEQRIRQRQEALDIGGMRLNPIGGGKGTAEQDRMALMAAEVDEIEREKQDREDARRAEIASAVLLLEMLPELESGVLHRYYVLRMSTGEIARELRRESSYVRKKKRDGEETLALLEESRVAATLPGWYLRKWPEEPERRR